MAVHSSDPGEEAGLGLIELLVAMFVAAIVVIAAASILVNSWLTQEDVTSTTQATTRGQVMGSAMERALRNAKDIQVLPTEANGTELRVWTTLGGQQTCQGFQLTTGTATIATSNGMLPAVGNWGEWETGILTHDGEPFIVKSGDTVRYAFDIETDSAPAQFSGEATMRSTATGEISPCW